MRHLLSSGVTDVTPEGRLHYLSYFFSKLFVEDSVNSSLLDAFLAPYFVIRDARLRLEHRLIGSSWDASEIVVCIRQRFEFCDHACSYSPLS